MHKYEGKSSYPNSGNLKDLGLGLPGWGKGVIVPGGIQYFVRHTMLNPGPCNELV